MNKIFVAASVAALSLTLTLPVSSYAAGAEYVVAQAQKKAVKTVTFNVGMHCQNCVKKVKENISFEKGVKDLAVSLDKQTITVTYDPAKTSVDKLAKAIEKLGYKAQKDTVNTAKQVK